jgi:hypothetical protein
MEGKTPIRYDKNETRKIIELLCFFGILKIPRLNGAQAKLNFTTSSVSAGGDE